jgi:hypothetical protein
MIGEDPDDKETGVAHRAGQGCQHEQGNSDRQLWPAYRRDD